MASYRLGAKALRLNVEWQTLFVPMGTVVQAARDTLFLDVGGALAPGIIDQHQAAGIGLSTAELVYSHPEFVFEHLLGRWVDRHAAGGQMPPGWRFTIVAHDMPDFDAVTAIWLARCLVETGEFPPIARALVAYASLVDQGRYRVSLSDAGTATVAVHLAYLAIQNLRAPAGADRNVWCVHLGLALLDAFANSVAAARREKSPGVPDASLLGRLQATDLYPGQPGVDAWRDNPSFAAARDLLDEDLPKYMIDCAAAEKRTVTLPTSDGLGTTQIETFITRTPPTSALNKYWVRAQGYPYFICVYANAGNRRPDDLDGQVRFPRVILSLDPTWSDASGRKPTLLGLGSALEAAECDLRNTQGGDTRTKEPRWSDGSVTNSDPWYDGRGHEHTIIDAPTSGTFMPLTQIIEIATGPFWHLPLAEAEVWVLQRLRPDDPRFPPATAVLPPDGFLPTLNAWFQDCRTLDLPMDEAHLDCPPGFHVAGVQQRSLPLGESLTPTMRLVRLEHDSGARGTLDALVAWGRGKLKEETYVFARVRVHPRRGTDLRADALLRDLCVGGAGAGSAGSDQDLAIFNGRAVAMRRPDDEPGHWPERSAQIVEVLLYSAFQADALARFSKLAGDAVVMRNGTLTTTGTARLLRQFLVFQSKYFHVQVVRDELVREVYAGLRETLGLDRLHEKVGGELDRLDQLEKDRAQRKTETLLFLVGLTGVIQAFTIGLDDVRGWQWVLVVVLLAVAVGYFLTVNSLGRDGGK